MKKTIIYLLLCITCCSCEKYLDTKPDTSLVVPSTVQDLQAILDNTTRMSRCYPFATELAADNIYLLTADYNGRTTTEKNIYIWGKDVYSDIDQNDWSLPYIVTYYANVVLDHVNNINGTDNVKGQALFFRSFSFYELLQVFAKPYKKDSAALQAGIPLKLSPDINTPTIRNNIEVCYQQVITDLKKAIGLLPVNQLYKTRPSKGAAYALLSRIYLSMRDYSNAWLYADSSLQLNNTLMDYNTLNASATTPIASFNVEDLFHCALNGAGAIGQSLAKMDSGLYRSYSANDLRKTIFFKDNGNGTYAFKGTYDGNGDKYNGLATDEMYLIRAECFARSGNTNAALTDLNTLLIKRWKTGTFIPVTATDATDALSKILTERRKELLMRGLRWTDLRRLNQELQWATTITKFINGSTYTLLPNDLHYVMQIPVNVINITGIEQNPY
ncbi:MAG: RagB/SusD family nutrient uptake outer membrane protein [Sphingobacteriia bacterium]|nr:RagB/SusD family nutrient uptake outer membrane protein [Sphingobacteriia bacterium]